MAFLENLNQFLSAVPWPDWLALLWFAGCWIGYTYYASHEGLGRRSLMRGTDRLRTVWMERMLERDVRIVDSALLGTLMHSVSFFASTTILIIGGLIAALGAIEREIKLTAELGFLVPTSRETWTLKLLALIVVFIYAFFKFTWSIRQFNRCSILLGAAPHQGQVDAVQRRAWARRLGRLNTLAGDAFNLGLRAYYFGMALLAWFIHPGACVLTSVWVVLVLYRREFTSETARLLGEADEDGEDDEKQKIGRA